MHYYNCTSCGNKIADKILLYRDEYLRISNNNKMTREEKEKHLTEYCKKVLRIKRYCCSFRINTGVDEADLLV
ncbi:hypothetical protein Hokovirus_3_95 [Hokovirus HKV1]|uniref:Uncharacterized protein n=1 Tax=Hokovirus HKV1 TaxID=1977638 RepID=A0A1V0SGH9_9VIRU|nr:hypothetical protein Hokovirus_3_95 [Hokovirus HKV1]